jgi:hypothetical protein
MRVIHTGLRILLCSSLLLIAAFAQSSTPQLWYWLGTVPLSQPDLTTMEAGVDQMASYGYTGVLIYNAVIDKLGSPVYPQVSISYLQQFISYIQSKGMKVTVGVAPYGWSDNMLVNNPNWAEGEHITGSQFTVNASRTALTPVNSFGGLVNGDYESGLTGWFSFGDPGMGIDTTVFHSGHASGYITNAPGNARFYQAFAATPWRQYHARMWVKTSNFSGYSQIAVFDGASNTTCFITNFQPQATQDWTEFDFTFNSRNLSQPALIFGVWGGSSGSIWFDDVYIEESSLVYVLRRPGTPLTVYDPANPGNTFVEGTDFNPISDPQISSGAFYPWTNFYHAPMTVTLPATTSLTAGQTVAIDYYAVQPITTQGDVGMCLTDTGPQQWLQQSAQNVVSAMPAGTNYLLAYDELRHMNSCATCKAKNMNAGQLLAWHVNSTFNLYHSLAPPAAIYALSDMFDPYHNAVNNYYYVEGNIAGSWAGLPSTVTVFNWNLGNLTNSLNWFSGLNPQQPNAYHQIIYGYYDSGNGAATGALELQQAAGIPGVLGATYVTNYGDYSQAQPFAAAVKSGWAAYLTSIVSTVTSQIGVSQTAFTYNRVTGMYSQTVKLTNNGPALSAAAFVLDSLPAGVTVANSDGTTSAALPAGSPYKEAGPIGAGATVTFTLQFTRNSTSAITYRARVLGAGPR